MENKKIVIIGTGNFAISLGKRFLMFGFEVVYGSRNPNKKYLNNCFKNVAFENSFDVMSIEEAWNESEDIVILAVQAKDTIYQDVVTKIVENIKKRKSINEKKNSTTINKSKIVIDISNRLENEKLNQIKVSNAQKLSNLFTDKLKESNISNYKINVVKGFNLINAYSLSSFIDTSGQKNFYDKNDLVNTNLIVPLCGDDTNSKQMIMDLCNKIGLHAYDLGSLKGAALKLELSNKHTFDSWYYPSIYSMLFFAFNFTWIFLIYYIFPKKPHTFAQYLDGFSLLSHLNKVLGYTSLQQLAFVYLGTIIASIYQLKNSTKYQHFPKYLDFWLTHRKQFGLWAFLFACAHLIATTFITNPNYLKDWYHSINETMTLNGEINLITGLVSFFLMLLVALSSINSVGNSLNWSEWRFVQTDLGIACLAMGTLHAIFMYLRIYLEKDKFNYSVIYLVTRVKLIAIYFPFIVLVLRFIFAYWRPLSDRIQRIRDGEYETKKQ